MSASRDHDCVVIGGGPAGLTAAYELGKLGRRAVVLEADGVVGGLSRTSEYEGYRFDVGGHRFFTKIDYVWQLWEEILGEELLPRPRLSRIYYRGKFFDYPLRPLNALRGLGLIESARVGISYARAVVGARSEERTFEQWVVNRFGRRLYEVFFKSYTEKVWGMPCSEISAEWAAQRIKNLNLGAALLNALLGSSSRKRELITTLIDRFHYPRFGPGQMWTRCAELIEQAGSEVRLNAPVVRLLHDGGRVRSAVVRQNGAEELVSGRHFVSSVPIRSLLHGFDPAAPPEVLAAASRLRYRDFLTVALIVDRAELFPDNWIYVHSTEVRVGRIQNYKNWSPDMVPDPAKTALGLEYFVQEGDEIWAAEDAALIALATAELEQLGIAPAAAVEGGTVLRMPKAYPIYDDSYKDALGTIREWLRGLPNLQLIGRNGQHRYNNQDHSMLTGVYAARNLAGASLDIWDINVEQSYHEGRTGTGDRLVPVPIKQRDLQARIRAAFAFYDPLALGVAVGIVSGLGLFLATSVLLLSERNEDLGANLSLLGQYLLGYTVSWEGALLGLGIAGAGGFAFGWALARAINALVARERRRLSHAIERARVLSLLEGDGT